MTHDGRRERVTRCPRFEERKGCAMTLTALLDLLKDTFAKWKEDKAPQLIIVVAIAGLALGNEAAQGKIVEQFQGLVGRDGAEVIQAMILHASEPAAGILGTVIGFITLLLGATSLVGELKGSLNTIW